MAMKTNLSSSPSPLRAMMLLVSALAWLLIATPSAVLAQINPQQNGPHYADSFCGPDFCVTGIYTPSQQSINYTMVIAGTSFQGWRAIGTGNQMAGSNMLITWMASGQPVLSHRSASGENQPQTTLATGAYTENTDVSRVATAGNMTVASWTFGGITSAPGNGYIWALNPTTAPTTNDVTSTIRKHSDYGFSSLDFTKAYTGQAPSTPPGVTALLGYGGVGGSTTSSSASGGGGGGGGKMMRELNAKNNIIIAHMVFMLLTWLILVPAAILVARWGRTFFTWFPVHRGIQLVSFTTLFIGFFLGVGATSRLGAPSLGSTHQKLGLAIFLITIFQVALGQVGHVVRRKNGMRIQNYFHAAIGCILFGLAIWNIHEGFDLWQWGVPNYASYIVYAWAAFLFLLYVAGFALLPREMRQNREGGAREEKSVLTHQSSPQTPP